MGLLLTFLLTLERVVGHRGFLEELMLQLQAGLRGRVGAAWYGSLGHAGNCELYIDLDAT